MSLSEPYVRFRRSAPVFDRALRWGQMAAGVGLFLAGIAIAPLPGPLGVPVSMLGLALVLKKFLLGQAPIRPGPAQATQIRLSVPPPAAQESEVYAPVFWQQALRNGWC